MTEDSDVMGTRWRFRPQPFAVVAALLAAVGNCVDAGGIGGNLRAGGERDSRRADDDLYSAD